MAVRAIPTGFQFTDAQIAEIQRLRDITALAENKQKAGGGVDLYTYVFKCITGIDLTGSTFYTPLDAVLAAGGISGMPQDQHLSLIWLYGALQVNSNNGLFAKVIREYNIRQGELRGMGTFSKAQLDQASNSVAVLFGDSILKPLLPDKTTNDSYHKLPNIQTIGENDLNGVRDTLYPGNENPPAELYLNQAWPGIIMLGGLTGQFTERLLKYDPQQPSAIDSLADFKNMLFAWDAFKTAANKTWDAFGSTVSVSDFLVFLNFPASNFATALNEYSTNGANGLFQFVFSTLIASQNSESKKGLDVITKIDSNKFLDMLIGAVEGKSLIGTTTDANFPDRARAFFDTYAARLQTTGAELLPTDAPSIAAVAKTDVNARAALSALSAVSVEVSSAVANKFNLYDPEKGEGNITEQWITDRSKAHAAFMLYWKRGETDGVLGAGIFPVPQVGDEEIIVEGATSTTTQKLLIDGVDFGVIPTALRYFGNDDANTKSGVGGDDHMYGMGGNDALNGMGGDDYLEGNSGDDNLNGGAGADELHGGADNDTLDGGADADIAIGGKGNDTLKGGDGADTLWGDEAQSGNGSKLYTNAQYSGNDKLEGGDGADTLYGGAGADTLKGDAGDDTLYGDGMEADDPLRTGNDTLIGGEGDDRLYGGAGNDTLDGGAGVDNLQGDEGNDTLKGGEGADNLQGGVGNDNLDGGAGADNLQGGAGFDTYKADKQDIIIDEDGQGTVQLGATKLGVAVRKKGETDYKDKAGNIYVKSGGTALVINGGLKIVGWSDGKLGITLQEDDIENIKEKLKTAETIPSPIALDLDGDGIETMAVTAGAHFDHASDGFAELTGWVAADDGLLVRDLNANGSIDTGAELFGDFTVLTNGTLPTMGSAGNDSQWEQAA